MWAFVSFEKVEFPEGKIVAEGRRQGSVIRGRFVPNASRTYIMSNSVATFISLEIIQT